MQIGRFKKKKKIFKIIQVIPTLISLANFLRSCSELKFKILNLDAKIVTVRSIDVIAMNINGKMTAFIKSIIDITFENDGTLNLHLFSI